MRKAIVMSIIIVLLSFVIAIYLYPSMPEQMASHWNANGEVDGFISKFWGLFLMPILSLVMWMIFLVLPHIDPMKKNIAKFRNYFDGFIIILLLFLLYLYLLTILWNLGRRFNMVTMLVPAFGLLFYYSGMLISVAKRNWFIGIRTPWTMSNEKVWTKTHKIGGILFRVSGIIALFGLVFPKYAFVLAIAPVISVVVFLFFYSYYEYRR